MMDKHDLKEEIWFWLIIIGIGGGVILAIIGLIYLVSWILTGISQAISTGWYAGEQAIKGNG